MAVQLPAQFIIFHRPVLPIDVFPIIEGPVTIMYIKCMFQCFVCPFLLLFADANTIEVNGRINYAFAILIIF